MYFSGHLADDFSEHIKSLPTDKISDIIEELSEDFVPEGKPRYVDKGKVSIAGVIAAKNTKITKSGDTMAFITLEDKLGEIEVIVFARQYRQYSDHLSPEGAVYVSGSISAEDTEAPRIILESLTPLIPNAEFLKQKEAEKTDRQTGSTEKKIYVKVKSLNDERIGRIYRIAALNRGNTKIIIFDESTRKYSVMKDVGVNASEKVITRLYEVFSKENVVVK